ncbi:CAP domain-containing protein [Danxiaibacter flavus]|uniref:CAP domain-containing protein n=1 Tax=Danxiaibacter flavus TaxID=3049108 RepID=A0ABV3Z8X5_9BACT|nr:CAP domain-containing protein [Chitinophagaceae bacterium DXS]
MKKILIAGLVVVLSSFTFLSNKPVPEKAEAKAAFELINAMRHNPRAFSKALGVSLNNVKAMPALVWNDTLAKVAEAKAIDMCSRNYFGHVNPEGFGMNYYINKAGYKLNAYWLKQKSANYFESIQAGASNGEDAVGYLVVDENIPSLGHRKHLLGIGDWNASLTDIGIGFVKNPNPNSMYKSFMCVLIARHE